MRGQKRVLKGVHARPLPAKTGVKRPLGRAMDARERAYDPRVHLFRQKSSYEVDGLHRNSGLPELPQYYAPQVG
jgi:hypothetical protein